MEELPRLLVHILPPSCDVPIHQHWNVECEGLGRNSRRRIVHLRQKHKLALFRVREELALVQKLGLYDLPFTHLGDGACLLILFVLRRNQHALHVVLSAHHLQGLFNKRPILCKRGPPNAVVCHILIRPGEGEVVLLGERRAVAWEREVRLRHQQQLDVAREDTRITHHMQKPWKQPKILVPRPGARERVGRRQRENLEAGEAQKKDFVFVSVVHPGVVLAFERRSDENDVHKLAPLIPHRLKRVLLDQAFVFRVNGHWTWLGPRLRGPGRARRRLRGRLRARRLVVLAKGLQRLGPGLLDRRHLARLILGPAPSGLHRALWLHGGGGGNRGGGGGGDGGGGGSSGGGRETVGLDLPGQEQEGGQEGEKEDEHRPALQAQATRARGERVIGLLQHVAIAADNDGVRCTYSEALFLAARMVVMF
mmetsp:Transcript_161231/g.517620  ORF Transcript_161231/g.517620 Transcript_161231/m.517620 type:complete len:423 (-) Transcript_161231:50-1318(-)